MILEEEPQHRRFVMADQQTINALQANWVWTPSWVDKSPAGINTAGRLVRFSRTFDVTAKPSQPVLVHVSADTRYKLLVNGVRVSVGPARSSILLWYYDTVDLSPFLQSGRNEIVFVVLRYFSVARGAMPFARTPFPGLTVVGHVGDSVDLSSRHEDWRVQEDASVQFPMGLIDDGFLHINERVSPRLLPLLPLPATEWEKTLSGQKGTPLTLPATSSHTLELQADVHSTAFLRWTFQSTQNTAAQLCIKVTYSEGYELQPRAYPFLRRKEDRLDNKNGRLIGPHDEIVLDLPADAQPVVYEPFWFRTFRLLRLEIQVTTGTAQFVSLEATQTNYPMGIRARWHDASDKDSSQIWDVSIRTMRNCMFDGYSDCPFYEQLQYSGDSRSVGLFYYLLSGDDRLMRQAMTNFAASITHEGLTQSRFPSHVPQIIAGFSLYWIMQVCDHHLFFGDTAYARSFLPRIDGVLSFFNRHIDEFGLVSGLPFDVWQYVDWVTTWGATGSHPDKGVPTAGRATNRHTYFSLLYAYTLTQAANLARAVGRPGYASEYEDRSQSVIDAVRKHCYDGSFFTESTSDVVDTSGSPRYSQHCQVFAVLSGAAPESERARLLTTAFAPDKTSEFAQCSYVMMFYALRAMARAGDSVYESFWPRAWNPWRHMLACNLTTWEEDNVRQRSDCHAWGSVPVYEYCTEVAGIHLVAAGASALLWKPRLRLSKAINATIALGTNTATVTWTTESDGTKHAELKLARPIRVTTVMPDGPETDHGEVSTVRLVYKDKT